MPSVLCFLSSDLCFRSQVNHPEVIQVDAANRSQHIGDHIQKAAIALGDKRLVNLIADTVQAGRNQTEQQQQANIIFDRQRLISPVKQDAHNGVRCKMKQLVAEFK